MFPVFSLNILLAHWLGPGRVPHWESLFLLLSHGITKFIHLLRHSLHPCVTLVFMFLSFPLEIPTEQKLFHPLSLWLSRTWHPVNNQIYISIHQQDTFLHLQIHSMPCISRHRGTDWQAAARDGHEGRGWRQVGSRCQQLGGGCPSAVRHTRRATAATIHYMKDLPVFKGSEHKEMTNKEMGAMFSSYQTLHSRNKYNRFK